jgi:2-polyprenyl-3-methyl-5-hydroxy-6-metoxy-1,4-benzoquinol methylase
LYQCHVEALGAQSQATQRVTPCLVCGAEQARAVFAIEDFTARVFVCASCGLGRLHPMPELEQVASFYPNEYYGEPGRKFQGSVERLVRWVGARHISFLSSDLRSGARVLDVGCGRGVILGALADRGFEVHGVEISLEAARGTDPRAEIRIAPSLADAAYPAAYFDEVVIWHVLEHLHGPKAALLEARRILRPGGRLVVAVPNFSSLQARWAGAAWFHLDLPRHLWHFPLAALRRLLGDCGFEIRSEHHFSLRQNPFGWLQSALNRVPGLPRNGLYTLLQRRAPGSAAPFSPAIRAWLWLSFLVGTPLGLLATLGETVARSGATVHLVAVRHS